MVSVLNVLFTRALANHLATSLPIIPTAVNPGFCYSEIHRDFSGLNKAFTKVCEVLLGRTAEQGARQLIWAALGPDGKDGEHVKHLRGAYVSTNQVCEPSDYVISKEGYEDQERVWVSAVPCEAFVGATRSDRVDFSARRLTSWRRFPRS